MLAQNVENITDPDLCLAVGPLLSYLGVENLLQGMTWLLPERFSDSEIGPEAGFVKFW